MKHQTCLCMGRLLPLLLVVTLLISSMALPASAASTNFTSWSYGPASGSIIAYYPARGDIPAQTISYDPHALEGTPAWSRLYFAIRDTSYLYIDSVTINEERYSVRSTGFAEDMILISSYGTSDSTPIPYFTSESAARLTALLDGTANNGYILRTPTGSGKRAVTSDRLPGTFNTLLDSLDALTGAEPAAEAVTVPLRDLRFRTPTVIYRMGDPTWFSVPEHFIYELSGGLYSLPASALSDDQFIAGSVNTALASEVTLYPLSDAMKHDLDALLDLCTSDAPTTTTEAADAYENEDDPMGDAILDGTDDDVAIVAVVFSGFLLPIAPIAVGLTKGLSRKPRSRRWLWMAAAGGVWFLAGLLLLILLLV